MPGRHPAANLLAQQIDVDVLFVSEGNQLSDPFFPSDTGLLHPTEGSPQEMAADLVDPDKACLDACSRSMRGSKRETPSSEWLPRPVMILRSEGK